MAEVRRHPWVRHLRSEPTAHVFRYRRGVLKKSGRGISFWFFPMNSAVAGIPIDARELSFLIHGKSLDLQDVTVQGEIRYRITKPETLGEVVDFSVDLSTGTCAKDPLEQIASLLIGQCQHIAVKQLADLLCPDFVASRDDFGGRWNCPGSEWLSASGLAALAEARGLKPKVARPS